MPRLIRPMLTRMSARRLSSGGYCPPSDHRDASGDPTLPLHSSSYPSLKQFTGPVSTISRNQFEMLSCGAIFFVLCAWSARPRTPDAARAYGQGDSVQGG